MEPRSETRLPVPRVDRSDTFESATAASASNDVFGTSSAAGRKSATTELVGTPRSGRGQEGQLWRRELVPMPITGHCQTAPLTAQVVENRLLRVQLDAAPCPARLRQHEIWDQSEDRTRRWVGT